MNAGYVTNSDDCNDAAANIYLDAPETCNNSIDENCDGTDEICAGDAFSGPIVATSVNQYGLNTFNTSLNLATATNSIQSPGLGNDLWISFTAPNNAVRIALTGATGVADDNDLTLYATPANPNIQLVPLATENDVHVGAQGAAADAGSETMLYGNLTAGSTYYVCVRNNNSTAGTVTVSIAALYGSTADISAYTGGTNTYSNACQNFKAGYKANAQSYTVRRWGNVVSGPANYSYTIPPTTTNKTVCQVGKILPPNTGTSAAVYNVAVDVNYALPDAFGYITNITGNGVTYAAITMNAEAALFIRTADQCPVQKSATTGAIFTNRALCGVDHYKYQFQETSANNAANVGLPVVATGAAGAVRQLLLNTVPSIANGKWYSVKVAGVHLDGTSTSAYATTGSCVKTLGAAGMPIVEEEDNAIASSLNGDVYSTIYPNPNNGSNVTLNVVGLEGDLQVRIVDATGRVVFTNRYVVEGVLNTNVDFGQQLTSGIYMVEMTQNGQHSTMRMVVNR
jgi:hypothetical protein